MSPDKFLLRVAYNDNDYLLLQEHTPGRWRFSRKHAGGHSVLEGEGREAGVAQVVTAFEGVVRAGLQVLDQDAAKAEQARDMPGFRPGRQARLRTMVMNARALLIRKARAGAYEIGSYLLLHGWPTPRGSDLGGGVVLEYNLPDENTPDK